MSMLILVQVICFQSWMGLDAFLDTHVGVSQLDLIQIKLLNPMVRVHFGRLNVTFIRALVYSSPMNYFVYLILSCCLHNSLSFVGQKGRTIMNAVMLRYWNTRGRRLTGPGSVEDSYQLKHIEAEFNLLFIKFWPMLLCNPVEYEAIVRNEKSRKACMNWWREPRRRSFVRIVHEFRREQQPTCTLCATLKLPSKHASSASSS